MKIENVMIVIPSLLIISLAILGCYFLSQLSDVNAQQSFAQITKEKFPDKVDPSTSCFAATVEVKYESPTIVLLEGDLIFGGSFNTDLWAAMNLLKSVHGFKIQQVMTSGVGSVQNPTAVYILMTK